jgi:hypothetical protein
MKNQILEEIYNDASQPGSLSGLENFYRVLKSKKINGSLMLLIGSILRMLSKSLKYISTKNGICGIRIDLWNLGSAGLYPIRYETLFETIMVTMFALV